jgi:hypothetical protein
MAKSNTCMLIILWVWSEGSRLKSPGNLKDNYNNNTVRPRSHGWIIRSRRIIIRSSFADGLNR